MKEIKTYLNDIILEQYIAFADTYKISIDLTNHAEDRQKRDSNLFLFKRDIAISVIKAAKQIRDDYDIGNLKLNDYIKIIDKSKNLNIICIINKDEKKSNFITVRIITEMIKQNMPGYNISKTYIVYINDNETKNYKYIGHNFS